MIYYHARFINTKIKNDMIDNSLQEIEDIEKVMIYDSLSCEIYECKN